MVKQNSGDLETLPVSVPENPFKIPMGGFRNRNNA